LKEGFSVHQPHSTQEPSAKRSQRADEKQKEHRSPGRGVQNAVPLACGEFKRRSDIFTEISQLRCLTTGEKWSGECS